ncbi:MAG TPA: hypothetical protein VFQ72_01130 [Candidatus Paceibacterota bacterium]|nr:hypothetical protein [Candidatus Paceibacterota bacterium]
MITKELIEHIKNQSALGKNSLDIKQELISSGGWSASDIDEAFRVINSTPRRSVLPYIFSAILFLVLGGVAFAHITKSAQPNLRQTVENPDVSEMIFRDNSINIDNSKNTVVPPIQDETKEAPLAQDQKTPTENQKPIKSYNLGTISIRAIVANIDEVSDKFGSYGMKFGKSKLSEVDQALQRLNTFVKKSSYEKAQLEWTTSGVYELGRGVCDKSSYGAKVNDLIERALKAADSESPLEDYSFYVVIHPLPDCPSGEYWSYEGRGQFKTYSLNGRTVNLRGIHISDLSDHYLFHEFGHSLGYKLEKGIGHPDYMNCPITTNGSEVQIAISNTCRHIFDFNSGATPIYTMMSTPNTLADYSAIEKETADWLDGSDIITATSGEYLLSALEQAGPSPKALKIPIRGTNYTAYVSFRLLGDNKPNGVILDITNGGVDSFLVTNSADKNQPLKIGTSYRLGTNGPIIRVINIEDNSASVSISSSN